MDLDGDGKNDILSGSYSRHDRDMAGLFQVLYGTEGGFQAPRALQGSDGKLLIVAADEDHVTDKICTRPTAVDLDGDGRLDIVTGNFTGTFALFRGEGGGKFAPVHSWLVGEDGQALSVDAHSDPFFVDWDGDGDLDLLSGSSAGGVFLFANVGTREQARWAARQTVVAPVGHGHDGIRMGEDWIQGPQGATRVWADDIDGDGKLDLLLGDSVTICHPAEGLDEATVKERLQEWDEKLQKLSDRMQKLGENADAKEQEAVNKGYEQLWKEREKIVREDMTGFVWVMYGR